MEQAKLIDERLATKDDIAMVRQDMVARRLSMAKETEVMRLDTKRDIESLRESTRLEIAPVRRDIEVLRRDLTVRLGGIVIASVAAASTIITLLARLPGTHS